MDLYKLVCSKKYKDHLNYDLDYMVNSAIHSIQLKNNPLRNLSNLSEIYNKPVEERKYLIEGILPETWYINMYSAGGMGKSYVSLQMAVALATGLPFLNHFNVPAKRSTIIVNEEDDENEMNIRIHEVLNNICEFNQVDPQDYIQDLSRIFVINTDTVIDLNPNYSISLIDSEYGNHTYFMDHLSDLVLGKDPVVEDLGLIIFDPLNRLAAIDLNDNAAVSKMITSMRKLARKTNSSILVINHSNKMSMQGSNRSKKNRDFEAGASLGAAALTNSARHSIYLRNLSEEEYKSMGLGADEAEAKYVVFSMPKANYVPPSDRRFFMQRHEGGSMSYKSWDSIRAEKQTEVKKEADRQEKKATNLKERLKVFMPTILEVLSTGEQMQKGDFCDQVGFGSSKATRAKYISILAEQGVIDIYGNKVCLKTSDAEDCEEVLEDLED